MAGETQKSFPPSQTSPLAADSKINRVNDSFFRYAEEVFSPIARKFLASMHTPKAGLLSNQYALMQAFEIHRALRSV
jgi:hypothetical protein